MLESLVFGSGLLLVALTSPRHDVAARICGLMMVAMWLICMAIYLVVGPDGAVEVGPVLDLIAGIVCICLWMGAPSNWLLFLAVSFVAQTASHTAYDEGYHTDHRRYILQVSLNVVAWLQLALLASGPRAHVALVLFGRLFPAPIGRYWLGCRPAKEKAKCRN
jgi:hypothetical protein